MLTRRHFVESLFAAGAAIPSLKNDGLDRLRRLGPRADGRTPAALADDEDFWREVQQAFTLDHTIINLNNGGVRDRKSTRLNSSHSSISYAVFCLKKKIQLLQRSFTV